MALKQVHLLSRYFSTEYLASYRSLTATYYPEYAASAHAAQYIGNGYFDVASPRSLTALPYDAASQFNRYFETEKTADCKYNPADAGSPAKSEFQPPVVTQPLQPPPPAPPSGKDNTEAKSADEAASAPTTGPAVKCEPVNVVFDIHQQQQSADLGQQSQQQQGFVVVTSAAAESPPPSTSSMMVGV